MAEEQQRSEEPDENEQNLRVESVSASVTADAVIVRASDEVEIGEEVKVAGGDVDGPEDGDGGGAPPVPPRDLLVVVGGVSVYVSLTERQRFLPVDGLIVPVGVRGGLAGGFVQSLKKEISPSVWGYCGDQN